MHLLRILYSKFFHLPLLILFLVSWGLTANAQVYYGNNIYLNHNTIRTYDNLSEWRADFNDGKIKLPAQVIVQFKELPGITERAELKEAQLFLLDYISSHAYVAVIDNGFDANILAGYGVTFITDVRSSWKISKEVLQQQHAGNKYTELTVSFNTSVAKPDVEDFLEQQGATIIDERLEEMSYCNIRLLTARIPMLAQWYGTGYIGKYREDVPLNFTSKTANRSYTVSRLPLFGGLGLKGEGVTIGVGDNVSGIFHIDLLDRITNYNPSSYTNHGVHINGIVAGAGIMDPRGEGTAPYALLTNHYFSEVLDATRDIYVDKNVTITNNSYSAAFGNCDYAGTYDALSVGLDKLCNSYDEVFHVFAAGNDGLFNCPPYPAGFASIAGGYQAAKNILVVTSTDKAFVNADNASRGPIKDGRLKPEITAVGVNVNSTTKSEEYLVASGTSMACPQVVGAAALITERYRQKFGIIDPKAVLLKALLMNGATDIGNPGPDFRFGFGFLNTERSVMMLDSGRYKEAAVTNGSKSTHNIVVPPNTAQLKVMLAWFDEAANPMAAKQLVTDLDLEVTEPNNNVHKPLILDPSPNNITNNAAEGVDRLNNTEQVVVNAPVPGNYVISVNGFEVPNGTKDYALVWDFVPKGVRLQYPVSGAAVKSDDSLYIYWDADDGAGTFTLEYSTDNGNAWNSIASNIPAEQRFYKWLVPAGINSGQCLMRLSRPANSDVYTTGSFVINVQQAIWPGLIQCPGYFALEWVPVPNATEYEVMRKKGAHMIPVDTVSTTTYTFKALSLDSTYYAAVRPLFGNLSGYRTVAIKRKPDDGDCAGNISDGDLMAEQIAKPVTGRVLTGTELTNNESLVVLIRNLDDQPCNNYKIWYRVNSLPWVSQTFTSPIAANSAKAISLPGLNLATLGSYRIRVYVENISAVDPVPANDSTEHTIRQLNNPYVMLDFFDGFETLDHFGKIGDTIGFGKDDRWDFISNTDTGQIRAFVLDAITIDGNSSLSLDAYKSVNNNINELSGIFNMANYDAGKDEVRLEFDYVIHGIPKTASGNQVLVKGDETKLPQQIFEFSPDVKDIGKVHNSGTISLSDALLDAQQNFSATTQVKFYQSDTSVIGALAFGNGITIDNFRMYTVQNDIQLLSITSPQSTACGITGSVPVVISIRNGVNDQQNNIQVNYRLDGGDVVSETISSVAPKETITYTFNTLADVSRNGQHTLDVWVYNDGDTYRKNDSILAYSIRNQPYVHNFPYFEDFESGNGYWYSDGVNNSWEYGTPANVKINAAASGKNAWVTNLDGNYNDNEVSYLYSPCFDISGLDEPRLSFKTAMDIENCVGYLCDGAHMEYTADGEKWQTLGNYGEGDNWYTDSNFNVWTIQDRTDWVTASIPLIKGLQSMQLRFVLRTDPGANREGMGVDDVRIFNDEYYIGSNDLISISPNPTTDGNISFEWAANTGTELNFVITDILGKSLYNGSAVSEEGHNKASFKTPMFSSGVYFIRLTIGEKVFKRKIVYRR